jgi:acetyl-CoA carboxylase carboxyltransferase component
MGDEQVRPELAELHARLAATADSARPDAVARRHERGQRTARENIADLVDPDSFIEYGGLALAAQRSTRSLEDLVRSSPADGVVCGIGAVGGVQTVIVAYDYTVFAGTQGLVGHRKLDRMFALAGEQRLPVVLFAEGGGGRPNDTDTFTVSGLDTPSFHAFAALSGWVPRVGIVSGRCFAGNAALLGCCDVIVATEDSNVGMAGPVMIEAGGLGRVTPEEIGPIDVQSRNGVVDVRVRDEAEAVSVARRYLSYFQGTQAPGTCAPQEALREMVPESRRRGYKLRPIVETLADVGSVLELRREFGRNLLTALIRVEGTPMGVLANDTAHLAGALDADASDKAARFLQLCDAFGLPVLSLMDTPGFMAGPQAEGSALVRHASRLFTVTASLSVPFFAVALRRGYGLGAQAMAGGHFRAPVFLVSWPTGEFGGMNLEGAVRIGMRKQLEAIADPAARESAAQAMIAEAQRRGSALNMASLLELDAVIDPAETRAWLSRGLRSAPHGRPPQRRRVVDSW